MGNTISDRLLLPDVLKGLAVLLMIQVHLMELFASQEVYNGLFGKISLFLGGPPAAPVFMVVMGYFIAKSVTRTSQLILRGCKLIFYGFLLNAGLNLHLLYHIFTGELNLNPLPYLFGVDILFLAGFSIIVIALLRLIFHDSMLLWITSALMVASAMLFLPQGGIENNGLDYLLAYFYKATSWSYFPLFPWLAYPLAGYSFYLFSQKFLNDRKEKEKYIYASLIFLIPLLIFFPFGVGVTTDLPAYYHHNIFYFLWAMLFLGFWTALLRILMKALPYNPAIRYLRWTGRNVTAFYVFQWLIIGNLATALYKSATILELIFWFVVISIFASLLVWVYRSVIQLLKSRFNPSEL